MLAATSKTHPNVQPTCWSSSCISDNKDTRFGKDRECKDKCNSRVLRNSPEKKSDQTKINGMCVLVGRGCAETLSLTTSLLHLAGRFLKNKHIIHTCIIFSFYTDSRFLDECEVQGGFTKYVLNVLSKIILAEHQCSHSCALLDSWTCFWRNTDLWKCKMNANC